MANGELLDLGLDFGADAFTSYLGNDVRVMPVQSMPSQQEYWSWLTGGSQGGLSAGDWLTLGGSILSGFDTTNEDLAVDRFNLDRFSTQDRSNLAHDAAEQAQYRLGEESALARDRLGLQRYGLEDKAQLDRASLGIQSQLAQERNEIERDAMRLRDKYSRVDAVDWDPSTPTQAATIAAGRPPEPPGPPVTGPPPPANGIVNPVTRHDKRIA